MKAAHGFLLAILATLFVDAAPVAAQDDAWAPERLGVSIPTRDGASLAADVLLPAKPGKYPCVVVQTPYDRVLMRPALRADGERAGPWDREHYAYVLVDWRGFFGSRGAGRAKAGQRGQDGFDVVEWTASQDWCDGKVGTWGPSALGRVQLDTAQEAPPHLVCCVPLVAPIGQRYEDYYEGGVYKEAHVEKLDALGFGVSRLVRGFPDPASPAWNLAAAMDHVDRMNVPMFFITGWYDHATQRELESFSTLLTKGGPKAREGSRLLVGPWTHMTIDLPGQGALSYPPAAGVAAGETKLFLDFHLRGQTENGWAGRPRARWWRCGETGWYEGDSWPPADVAAKTFSLHSSGVIDEKPAAADEPPRAYLDDPASPVPTIGGANLPAKHLLGGPRDQAELLSRDDVLVYETPVLDAPLRLDGVATVDVSLVANVPSIDVAARLCERLPDGRTMLVADSIRREKTKSGPPTDVVVTLPPLSYAFGKGSRLVLLVSGTNWPRFERNPHTSEPHFDAAKSAPAQVQVLRASLVLPLSPEKRAPGDK